MAKVVAITYSVEENPGWRIVEDLLDWVVVVLRRVGEEYHGWEPYLVADSDRDATAFATEVPETVREAVRESLVRMERMRKLGARAPRATDDGTN